MASEDYLDGYRFLEELVALAKLMGATSVRTDLVGPWPPVGELEAGVHASAEIVTADGVVHAASAIARPGDARTERPEDAAEDINVETRAQARALRTVIKRAYPEPEEAGRSQTPTQRRLQALLREVAALRGMTRDDLAREVAQRNGLQSTAALSAAQADIEIIRLEAQRDLARAQAV